MSEPEKKRGVLPDLLTTYKIFSEINGDQRAAAFGFYAFFALFPLLLMLVSAGAIFLEPETVERTALNYIDSFMPLQSENQEAVSEIIGGVMSSSGGIGLAAVAGLLWSASNFFQALVRGVNRAWHTQELSWWRVPLKNLLMVATFASALLIGIVLPAVFNAVQMFIGWDPGFLPFSVDVLRIVLPSVMLFYGLLILYKVSPRRKTHFKEVWIEAAAVTLLLKLLQNLLVFYSSNIWQVNALYGAMGTMIILLLWVYLCGMIVLLGACHCAARAGEGPT